MHRRNLRDWAGWTTEDHKTVIFNPYRFFTPLSLNPTAWWDATDLATLLDGVGGSQVSNGAQVLSWQDKSGNGNHLNQYSTVNGPLRTDAALNGTTALRFDGAEILQTTSALFSGANPRTVVAVYLPRDTEDFNWVAGQGTNSGFLERFTLGFDQTHTHILNTYGSDLVSNVAITETPFIGVGTYDGVTKRLYFDDQVVSKVRAISTAAVPFSVGSLYNFGRYHAKMDLGSVLVFPTALNQDQITKLTQWLSINHGF